MQFWPKHWATRVDSDLLALSDQDFLEQVYRRYLGRSVDNQGRLHYAAILKKWRGRQRVLLDIQQSAEARCFADYSHQNPASSGLCPQMYPPLLPNELTNKSRIKPRVVLLGTCLAEGLLQIAQGQGWAMQHYLMDSGLSDDLPDLSEVNFDVVMVNLTLRTVLGMAVVGGNGDLFYLRPDSNAETVLASAKEYLHAIVLRILTAIPPGFPVFFLSFLEPPAQIFGVFERNRGASLYTLVRTLNDTLEDILLAQSAGAYLELNDILQYYGDAGAYDGYASHYTHNGLYAGSQQGEWIFRDVLERLEGAYQVWREGLGIKLIITDLDNTLWRGVLAEEDELVPWQHIEGWPIGYAEALLVCKRRGVLLAISSKNDETPTRERFRSIWGDALRLDDFCAIQINWKPKSVNIAEILQAANILPEHVLFIDDNPLEISEVQRSFPQMRFLSGNPERWRHVLLYSPETQVATITEESRKRTELVQAQMARNIEAKKSDRDSWLNSLELVVHLEKIANAGHIHYLRALELLNKTNQFNTTGQRWSDTELQSWLASGGYVLAARAIDHYANHGLIALALVREQSIEQMVLSCRMFGLGIESALLSEVVRQMREAGYADFIGHFSATGRNDTCRNFWHDHGFTQGAEDALWRASEVPNTPEWISVQVE